MSRKGNCWDNAVAESFFKTIKYEWLYRFKYASLEQLSDSIAEYKMVLYKKNTFQSRLSNFAGNGSQIKAYK